MSFSDLGLSAEILRAVADAGYKEPTPIQQQAIPYVLMGRDILGCAQTGTGKTASFTLPMIEILASGRAKARMPRTLILEPTRELAAQVSDNFQVYGKHHNLTMALLIGGVSFDDQESKLDRGVDVLIATPGRLLDHFERGRILLNDVKILVIDEADRMLDMGFIPDVERIVSLLPRMRQTLFFSATMPPEIKRLADQFLMNPKEVTVAPPASPAETVAQALVRVAERDKRAALRHLLRAEDVRNALVFCNRKKDVQILQRSLKKHGFNAGALHGDMHQSERMETLDAFRKGDITILVCSDVAARGLDIAFLSHVFNFDVPIHAEDYVHRIGRTGRAGREGKAFMLATSDDGKFLSAIERLIGRPIPKVELEGLETGGDEDEGRGERGDRRHGRDRHAGERQSRGRGERRERPERARDHETPAEHGQADQAAEPLAAAAASVPAEPQQPYRGQPKPPQGERERNTRDRQGRVRNEPPVKLAVDNDRHRGRGRRRDRDDDDPPVVGLGDHVPAFLLRAPRRGGVGA